MTEWDGPFFAAGPQIRDQSRIPVPTFSINRPQEVRAILGTDLPFDIISQKLDLPELQVRMHECLPA